MIVGMGIDLVEIERIDRLLAQHGSRALARLFTESEVAFAMAKGRPAMHLAARVAAKEAAFKALSGTEAARAIGWRELEVRSAADGRPSLVFHGGAAARATELGVTLAWLTLSHSQTTAAAVVILEG